MLIEPIPAVLVFVINFALCAANDLGEVVFVTFLYRHGDRTPIKPYPNDPYKNVSNWPAEWGELTDIGKRGHYNLGKWLRDRYDNILPKKYNRNDIYVQSTDVDRTLMSASCNLAGLYEPDSNSNWSPDIKWSPIPIHTIPKKLDKVLAGEAPCPKYTHEMDRLMNSPEFKKINEKYKKLYEYLALKTGENVTNLIDAETIHDTLFIESLYNFTLPNWTKAVYPRPLRNIAEFSFSIPCYTQTLARLKMGPFFSEILEHMEQKISGKMNPDRKAWMYSAHDTTVANVLKSLNLFEPHCPPYLSLIIFELRKMNNNYFVAMYYHNSTSVPPYLLQLQGCEKLCPFKTFMSILSKIIPKNWDEECQMTLLAQSFYNTTASISFITIISFSILFLLSVTLLVNFYKKEKWNQTEFAYKSLKMDVTS